MKEKSSKYVQIANEINQEISAGKFKPGEKLSTEKELQERFNVSRMTIRHAIAELEKRKAVRVDFGRGASVADLEVRRSQEILGVKELFERRGIHCTSKVTRLERGLPPNEEVKKALELQDDEEIYYLYRTRYAQDEVVVIEYAHIAAKHCPGLEMFNFEKYSLYDIFFEHYHINMAWAKDDIRADTIRGDDAQILLNAKSGPALIVNNISYDNNNVPIEYTVQIYNYKIFTYTVVSTEISSKYLKR